MIPFTKAHACGNDFLIVAAEAAPDESRASLTRRLCARTTGIGADGIEFFNWTGPAAGRIRLHNADGSIAEISGNGTRCVAAWMAQTLGSKPGDELAIETDAGLRVCRIENLSHQGVEVTTGMGIPTFSQATIRIGDGTAIEGAEVSMGNPHFVIVVDSPKFATAGRAWQTVGAEICIHPQFADQTNVEFVRISGPREVEIRIFERGVGPTSSSGTGSSAAATAAIALGLAQSPLRIVAPGGAQSVAWNGPGTELMLTGPAALIARGEAWPA